MSIEEKPAADLPGEETVPCRLCAGTGRVPKPCNLCKGYGYVLESYVAPTYGNTQSGGTLSKRCPNGCQMRPAINAAMACSMPSWAGPSS